MPVEFLSQAEFDRWAFDDRLLKTRILDHMETQAKVNAETGIEIALLKVNHTKSAQRASTVSAGIATIVSGIVSGIIGSMRS